MKSDQLTNDSERFAGSAAIAVIGIGCLFPDAAGPEEYWNLIEKGRDAIGPIPLTHWSPADYYDADPKRPDHTYAQTGGFLKPYSFDPLAFGLAPHALEATDTTQLLGMVAAHQALVDAGYGPTKSFDKDRVSCILGVTGTLELVIPLGARLGHPIWKKALADAGVPDEVAASVLDEIGRAYVPWQENSFPGLLGNVVAGRIANRLDLGGTNSVVDAACASSLAALHMAMMELQTGRADLVISGGMDTFNSIFMYMCFSKTPALSPSGQARPFDAAGDGTILGEGLGAVILKRLDDALRDGDRIYGVLRGMGTASDGKGQAIYAPSARGQVKTLERAYREAGVSPRSIGLVEAHGTGTKVGDGVELEALKTVYRAADPDARWCRLGSVKSQIGHTKAAAGAAGLIKALLALHHKVLPPTIKVREPHPQLSDAPFILEDEARPWVSGGQPRRAAVSAFGFGGSDYHCVLEEFAPERREVIWDPELYVAAFSADDQLHLVAQLHAAQEDISRGLDLRELCRAWRQEFNASQSWRIAAWALGRAAFEEKLVQMVEGLQKGRSHFAPGIEFAHGAPQEKPRLAFIFAGQGSQKPGMLRELACRFPEFLQSLETSEAFLLGREGRSLSDLIYPPQAFDRETRREQSRQLTETVYTQLSLATLGIAAVQLLRRFGLEGDFFAGHSFGELLALHAAGALSEEATLRAAYERGLVMSRHSEPGSGLLAVLAPVPEAEAWLKEAGAGLSLANINAPEQLVIGGKIEDLEKAAALLRERGIASKRLEVSAAFHTPLMGAALGPFREQLATIELAAAQRPVYANLSGALYPETAESMRETLAQQLVSPVRFSSMLRAMQADGADIFVEIGPQQKLAGIIKASVSSEGEAEKPVFSLDSERDAAQVGLAKLLLSLSVRGVTLRWDAWDPGATPDRSQLQKPRFHVQLSGANYRAPQAAPAKKEQPRIAAAAPKPPETPVAAPLSPPEPAPKPLAAPAPRMAAAPLQTAVSPSAPLSSTQKSHALHPSIHGVDMSQPNFGEKQRVEKLLNDLQDIQRRTTDAHTLFLENQRQFQGMLKGILTQDWTDSPAVQPGAGASASPQPAQNYAAPAPAMSAPQPAPAPAPLQRPAPPPVRAEAAPASRREAAAAPQPQQVRAEAPQASRREAAAPQPLQPPRPAPAVAAASAPAAASRGETKAPAGKNDSSEAIVLGIIARLTGYPEAMLQTSMQLESDLGIDSIKKVEIYAQLQENFPTLSSDAQTMNEMQTVADLIVLCAASSQDQNQVQTQSSLDEEPRVGAWAAGQVALAVEPVLLPKAKMRELLAIIADKTGFPAEMLHAEMDLESDLGIDSIKKVEIFSAVQEHFAELGTLDNEQLNAVRTIADFEVLLQGQRATTEAQVWDAAAPFSPEPAAQGQGTGEAEVKAAGESPTAFVSSTHNAQLVYKIVAEKTGYPEAVLSGDMELEADLGIDSIKKVEIYSALGEHFTSVKGFSQEETAEVRTLADLIAQLGGDGQSHDELLAEALLDPSLAGNWDLSAKKKEPAPSFSLSPEALTQEPPAFAAGIESAAVFETEAEAEIGAETETEAKPAFWEDALAAVSSLKLGLAPFEGATPVRTFSSTHEVWIADDGSNLARNMMLKLQERGVQARLVSLAMHERWQVPENLGGLFLLAPLKFDHHPLRWLQQSFKLMKKVGPALSKNSGIGFIVTVSRHGGRFGLDGLSQLNQAYAAGAAGLVKTIAHEWPGIHARALDIGRDFADGFEAALRVLDASVLEGPIELGVTRDQLFKLVLTPEELAMPQQPESEILQLGAQQLVLVTGGARGVTAASLLPLAEKYQPHFVIWGRTAYEPSAEEPEALAALSDPAAIKRALLEQNPELAHPRELEAAYRTLVQQRELRSNISQLEAKGARVTYQAVDVSQENDLRRAFQELRENFGWPVGVIHGAGVIHDKLLLEQKDEEVAAVLETKLRILPKLEEWLLASQSARASASSEESGSGRPWLLLFSSSTARLGRKGQGAYAVANEVLNKFAHYASQVGGRALALNWGPWDGGMVQDSLKKVFVKEGIAPIPLASGAALMRELLERAPESGEWLIATKESLAQIVAEHERALHSTSAAITIDLNRTPILADHVLKHRAVVPAALLLEWLCVAAHRQLPQGQLVEVENFQVWKGIVLDPSQSYAVTCVTLRRETGASDLSWFEMSLRALSDEGNGRAHAHARLAFKPTLDAPEQREFEVPVASPELSAVNMYEDMLFHGEKLHLLEELLSCDDKGLWARVRLQGQPQDWAQEGLESQWVLHAPLLDAVFQAAIVWSTQQLGMRSLPSRLGRISCRGELPAEQPLFLELRLLQQETHLLKLRAEILDAEGRSYWSVDEFEVIMDASLTTPFAQNRLDVTAEKSSEPDAGRVETEG